MIGWLQIFVCSGSLNSRENNLLRGFTCGFSLFYLFNFAHEIKSVKNGNITLVSKIMSRFGGDSGCQFSDYVFKNGGACRRTWNMADKWGTGWTSKINLGTFFSVERTDFIHYCMIRSKCLYRFRCGKMWPLWQRLLSFFIHEPSVMSLESYRTSPDLLPDEYSLDTNLWKIGCAK